MNNRILLAVSAALLLTSAINSLAQTPATLPSDLRRDEQRLSFQTSNPWEPREELNADVAMCYGIDKSLPDRLKSWQERGYTVELMTGVSWGNYQDYVSGKWDGKNHEDEAQPDRDGKKVIRNKDVYYMSPGPDYGQYLAEGVRRALDAGSAKPQAAILMR